MPSPRGSRRASRTAALALGIVCVALTAGCTPQDDLRLDEDLVESVTIPAFYEQPDDVPAGGPGELVKHEEILGGPSGSRAWRIMYHSIDLHGEPIVVTGLVVAPSGPAPEGGRTVVSWGHPTTGAAQECAPSASVDPFVSVEGLTSLIDRGYVVAYTDYAGLGTSGPKSFLVGATEGSNVLDAARAARAIPETGSSNRIALWGHSQGGHAALFAAESAASYAPELELRAVAVAAPAADLGKLLDADIGDVSGVTISSFAFTTYEAVYAPGDPSIELDTILTPEAIAVFPKMAGLCLLRSNSELHSLGTPLIGKTLTADPATTEPWAALLQQNTPGTARLDVPLLVVQGLSDTLVRPEETAQFVEHERSLGTNVQYSQYDDTTHATIALRAMPEVEQWLLEVGAGPTAAG